MASGSFRHAPYRTCDERMNRRLPFTVPKDAADFDDQVITDYRRARRALLSTQVNRAKRGTGRSAPTLARRGRQIVARVRL